MLTLIHYFLTAIYLTTVVNKINLSLQKKLSALPAIIALNIKCFLLFNFYLYSKSCSELTVIKFTHSSHIYLLQNQYFSNFTFESKIQPYGCKY